MSHNDGKVGYNPGTASFWGPVMASVSPFHPGEQEIQARLGMRDEIEDIGQRFIRDHLPEQHQEFYANLPYLVVGSVDDAGRPWASLLAGSLLHRMRAD